MPTERLPGEWESPITSELITSAVSHSLPAHCYTALGCRATPARRARLPPAAQRLPYAARPSLLPAASCLPQTKRLGAPSFAPNGDLFWLEGRPAEKGRQVLVRRPHGGAAAADLTPGPDSGLNVRTRVQVGARDRVE